MKIELTSIPDVLFYNEDEIRYKIGEEVEKYILPLFKKKELEKQKEVLEIEKKVKEIKEKVSTESNHMKSLMTSINRQKLVRELLKKIYKIVKFGLAEKSRREDIILLLKGIDNLDEDLLKKHISELSSLISKSISSVDVL